METLLNIDWKGMFIPTVSPLEIIIRGSVIYLGIFILLRVILKREKGGVATSDLLVLVLLADAAQNGMAGNYQSITNGLLLVATIIFWTYFLDFLAYHWPWLDKLIQSPPLLLVQDGKLQLKNMRKEMITRNELSAMLREQGVEDLSKVKRVLLENDGQISVIKQEEEPKPAKKKKQKP